ncbi:TetR/AcrR family transcriptional regulator [Kitasatospora sp. NPDC051853]|uniref:TetR/AcrR family transcriptional regulator n=1 Tax=Kitasatospora sp. NPDC051853 TaxID=3364058 RepID=UPI00379DF9CB
MTDRQDRPLRADAARNRARLLAAATEVFTTRGTAVPTEEIARAAGVGVGTLFRHFPTKEALLQAVMVGRLEEVAARVAELAAGQDPADAFFGCFRLVVESSVGKGEFTRALAEAGVDAHAALHGPSEAIRGGLTALLESAQRAGAVRPGLAVPELIALLVAAGAAVERLGTDAEARDRVLTVITDGLRPR